MCVLPYPMSGASPGSVTSWLERATQHLLVVLLLKPSCMPSQCRNSHTLARVRVLEPRNGGSSSAAPGRTGSALRVRLRVPFAPRFWSHFAPPSGSAHPRTTRSAVLEAPWPRRSRAEPSMRQPSRPRPTPSAPASPPSSSTPRPGRLRRSSRLGSQPCGTRCASGARRPGRLQESPAARTSLVRRRSRLPPRAARCCPGWGRAPQLSHSGTTSTLRASSVSRSACAPTGTWESASPSRLHLPGHAERYCRPPSRAASPTSDAGLSRLQDGRCASSSSRSSPAPSIATASALVPAQLGEDSAARSATESCKRILSANRSTCASSLTCSPSAWSTTTTSGRRVVRGRLRTRATGKRLVCCTRIDRAAACRAQRCSSAPGLGPEAGGAVSDGERAVDIGA
ncbi:hypothetical protein DMC30DRAFT_196623 [Rhodotorula diobovata]|uniref:Uncharacterized protein n=1 Tax=Rhodotorula diobovata TaxID=5288 RepID=A0A5C5FXA4_9BASI|nr:hypothetical protein DMC30DRAFT_196623 [Rhodotorula diobovata]